jgi:hypothetical protein
MKNRDLNSQMKKAGIGLLAGVMVPGAAFGCACGCGVFDVGTSSMFPAGAGGMAWAQYDYQDQNHNWSGSSSAPAANNGDKEIETHFVTLGLQYMFNSNWGAQIELPYDYRSFTTVTGNPKAPNPGVSTATLNWASLGDIRLEGIYTGFFADQSAGVTFGLKLPTGDWTYNNAYGDIDRDTELGTGSTDILLGGFYRGNLDQNQKWDWFAQGLLDVPVLTEDQYRPGVELDTAAGIDYKGFSLGRVRISPVAQAIFSYRSSDSGANAAGGANDDPEGGVSSGYERLLLSPGIEFHIHPVKIYADVEVPVWQHFTGNQLAAPVLFKLSVSYMF